MSVRFGTVLIAVVCAGLLVLGSAGAVSAFTVDEESRSSVTSLLDEAENLSGGNSIIASIGAVMDLMWGAYALIGDFNATAEDLDPILGGMDLVMGDLQTDAQAQAAAAVETPDGSTDGESVLQQEVSLDSFLSILGTLGEQVGNLFGSS
jgi:hypothetical protein